MTIRCFFALAALVLIPAAALAQDRPGASVGATISAAAVDSDTELALSGAFIYHVTPVIGFEVEATYVPTLEAFDDDGLISILSATPASLIFPSPRLENPDGRMVIVSNNIRIAVPTRSTRLEPYFVAGGGIASVRETADYVYPLYDPRVLAARLGSPVGGDIYSYPISQSSVDMSLTIGGGVSVRAFRQMSVDADLRMFRLLGQEDRNVGRFGVGVRYRF